MLRSLFSSLGVDSLFSGRRRKPDQNSVLAELRELGFFAHFTDSEIDACTASILERGWNAIDDNPRFFWVDAENLSEGGVAKFLREIKPFLERLNMTFSVSNNWGNHDYTVTLNRDERLIWSLAEFEQERNGRPGLTWGLTTVRTFGLVNEMLETAQTDERLYAVDGGNDLRAIFLTPKLKEAIWAFSDFPVLELPYIPKFDEEGWFGQPH